MSRTREIDDSQILEVARKIFVERGLSATTKMISRAAGISEGVIFQRFGTKERLIEAVFAASEIDADALVHRAGAGPDPRRAFEDVVVAIFAALRREAGRELPLLATRATARRVVGGDSLVGRLTASLAAFLSAEARSGRLAIAAPDRVAGFVVGALHHMALVEVASGPSPHVSERAVRDVAAALVAGVGVRSSRER